MEIWGGENVEMSFRVRRKGTIYNLQSSQGVVCVYNEKLSYGLIYGGLPNIYLGEGGIRVKFSSQMLNAVWSATMWQQRKGGAQVRARVPTACP